MSLLWFISIVLAFLAGLLSQRLILIARQAILQRRGLVVVPPGESSNDQYQRYKAAKNLKLLPAPKGSSLEATKRWNKLGPLVQRQVIAARKKAGIDG